MLTIERRIEALETAARDETMKVIIAEDGETRAEALERVGLSPDAVRVVTISPLDARL